jgi:hypothetical protein
MISCQLSEAIKASAGFPAGALISIPGLPSLRQQRGFLKVNFRV